MQTPVNCCVRFFHTPEVTRIEIQRLAKGSELYDEVCQTLSDDVQFNLFGLEFAESIEYRRWLDLNKQLKSQIPPHITSVTLLFKIKFFDCQPQKIQNGFTRTLYVAQLAHMLREGSLRPQVTPKAESRDQLSEIGALVMLLKFGKFSEVEMKNGTYMKFLRTAFVPLETVTKYPLFVQRCIDLYRDMPRLLVDRSGPGRRSVDELARDSFLDAVSRIERYGYQFYQASQAGDSSSIEIGVSTEKISIFQNSKIIRNLRWKDIAKLAFKNALFSVEIFNEDSPPLHQQEQETLTFSLNHYRTAKELWHTCVDHHSQYRSAQGASPVGTPPLDREKQHIKLSHRNSQQAMLPSTTVPGSGPAGTQHSATGTAPGGKSSMEASLTNGQPASTTTISNNNSSLGGAGGGATVGGSHSATSSSATDSKSSQDMHVATLAVLDPSFSVSPPHFRRRNLEVVPNERGKFGFSFDGGDDRKVTITKIDPSGAAKKCTPPLNEGDEILEIFGRAAAPLPSTEITNLIRETGSRFANLHLTVLTQILDDVMSHSPLENSINELQHQLHLNSNLANAFHTLEKKKASGTYKFAEKNAPRNRYNDVWPYDDTRVALSSENDYINANFVRLQLPDDRWLNYIAAQGPLDHTVEDFWRMIYDQNITHVIMVTALKERDIRKCAKYWPEINCATPTSNNEFLVDCTSEEQNEGYTTRNFTLQHRPPPRRAGALKSFKEDSNSSTAAATAEPVRDICQCQFHDWPDHGVPQGTKNFINFIQTIRDFRKKCSASFSSSSSCSSSFENNHILVHCSAGIGRTGVVILTEACFNLIDLNKELPLISILRDIRAQRPQLIQNWAQFSFVCRSVLAYYDLKQRNPQLHGGSSNLQLPQNATNISKGKGLSPNAVAAAAGSGSVNKHSVC